ncbi:MAG: hypothetical protein ACI3XR_04415 [Eubacteriales bacterium]
MKITFYDLNETTLIISDGVREKTVDQSSPGFETAPDCRQITVEEITGVRKKSVSEKLGFALMSFFTVAVRALLFPNKHLVQCLYPYKVTEKISVNDPNRESGFIGFHPCEYVEYEGRYTPPSFEFGSAFSHGRPEFTLDEDAISEQIGRFRTNLAVSMVVLLLIPLILFITAAIWDTPVLGVIAIGLMILAFPTVIVYFVRLKKQICAVRMRIERELPYLNEHGGNNRSRV